MGSAVLYGRFSRPIFWAVGLILFVAAFFLPAVQMPPSTGPSGAGPGTQSTDFAGWECAEITPIFTLRLVQATIEPQRVPLNAPVGPKLLLVAASGWVNPLLLFYLLSCVVKKLSRCRPFLAGLIVLALIATWIFLAGEHFPLLLGHYLWVVGIVLTLAARFVGQHGLLTKTGVSTQNP